jgi:exopolysaccharide biosynthesis predicted pyruvyltransferase EpsI
LPLAGTSLDAVLRELADQVQPFLYHSVPGNAGDSAINCSAYRLFEERGLRYELIEPGTPAHRTAGRVVVCSGGGNLVPMYRDVCDFLSTHHSGCRRLILLPHTVRGHENLLARLGSNVTLLCRDQGSVEHVRRHAPRAHGLEAHDIALHLDVRAVLAEARWRFLPLVSSPSQARRNLRRRWRGLKYDRRNADQPRVLSAFRTDVESAGRELPAANFDVSVEYVSDDMSPVLAFEATYRMLAFLDRYATVHTDRLHVAILSALLDKRVMLHDNSYGKNSAIYEHSMRERFPNVTLCDRQGEPTS